MSEWRDAGADVYYSSCKLVYCWMSDCVILYTIIKTFCPCIAFERHTSCTDTKLKFSFKPCESIASPNSHPGLHFAYLKTDEFDPAKQPHIPNSDRLSPKSYINTIPTRSAMEGRAPPTTYAPPAQRIPSPALHARKCTPRLHPQAPCTSAMHPTSHHHHHHQHHGPSRRCSPRTKPPSRASTKQRAPSSSLSSPSAKTRAWRTQTPSS
jgi:hypothetical protein